MRFLKLITIILLLSININAQEPSIRFQHLTPEKGLSQGHVLCMMQDRTGYIWMGTYYGLNRYDGYNVKLFSKDQDDTTSIFSDVIYSLFEDRDGYIWAGTVSGLEKFDKTTETFSHYIRYIYIQTVTQDSMGNIWVATNNNGIYRIEYQTEKIMHFTAGQGENAILTSNSIKDISLDASNQLWIASDGGGLSCLDTESLTIKRFMHQPADKNSIATNKLSTVFIDNKNNVWTGSPSGELIHYNQSTQKFENHKFIPTGFVNQSVHIRDISQDTEGNILVASMGAGLAIYNPETRKSTINIHNIYDQYSLASNEAYSLLVDRTGTVFVGTYGRGSSRYSPNNQKFKTHYVPTLEGDKGDINSYTACVQDTKGRLIIGSYNGFFVFNQETWEHQHYLPGNTYSENKILSMAMAPDSSIWIGSLKGLHHYDKNLNKIATYHLLDDDLEHPIYSLFFDDRNNLWLGLFVIEGLFKIPEKEWRSKTSALPEYTRYRTDEGDSTTLYGDQIWTINQDREGRLWIGTNLGICTYNYEKDNFTRYEITPLSKTIIFDDEGDMWVATRGEGVVFYDMETGHIKNYTASDGLSQNFVFGAIIDGNDKLWFTTEDGLSKFDPETEEFRNYDIFDGLPNNRFDDRSEKRLPNGEVYMGTSRGFMVFRPEAIKDDTSRSVVVLSNLTVSNKKIEYDHTMGDKNQLNAPIGQAKEIKILPHQKDFSIEFAALHYSATHKNEYKYKLEGFDEEWIHTTAKNRTARYTNLDGNTYTFKVKATNGDGVWYEEPITVSVIVQPPFYNTMIFKAFVIALFVLLTFLFFRERIARQKKQNIRLATLVNERTSEISEKNKLLKETADNLQKTNTLLEKKQKDIEKQKEELAEQRDKLAQLNGLKDKLFSIIAHDLTNPFNTIIGFSELMLINHKKYDDEKRLFISKNINDAAQNAYSLLQNLLDWSRSQTGRIGYHPEKLLAQDIIATAINQVESFAKSKNITIEIDEQYLNSMLNVDRNMMSTVIRNLLNNALKFSHKNTSVLIRVSRYDETFDQISIIDHGIGMPPNVKHGLFKVDKDISQKGTAGEKGTGLGLLICKEFVETHNGRIWVESEENKGATFHFTVPRAG
ncbi:MAG: two-component regulator propeller domain-containing protein [Bacteroidota bacterium]